MALTNTKRRLNESSLDNESYDKAPKRHHSDRVSLSSSVSHRAAKQPGNRNTHTLDKATKPKPASDKTSDSAVNKSPAFKTLKATTRKKADREQKAFSPEPSLLDESNVSIANPTDVGTPATSKVALPAPSSPPSEKALGEGEGSENEEKYDDEEDDDDDDNKDEDEDATTSPPSSDSSMESNSDVSIHSDDEPRPDTKKKEPFKADNPTAFASSMAGILGYKLTRTQRQNPILARSATAKEADETLLDKKLEKKAKAEMKKEKEKEKETHGGGDALVEGQGIFAMDQQEEKELRKMAQRGVIKMFNAFNSVREKAAEAQRLGGTRAKREEKATEMSKEGWLEYIGQGAKGKD